MAPETNIIIINCCIANTALYKSRFIIIIIIIKTISGVFFKIAKFEFKVTVLYGLWGKAVVTP